jgi:general stress protein YciG
MATSDRGFASMPKKRQVEIARMGGKASARSRRNAANSSSAKRGGQSSRSSSR